MSTSDSKKGSLDPAARLLMKLLKANEEWLMERILDYAKRQEYAQYTSTLKEAWRLSISGLSLSIIKALQIFQNPPEMTPEKNPAQDEISLFGVIEAQRHKERGVSLLMFLGLMKYYRQAYVDLICQSDLQETEKVWCELFTNRVFDRIEIAFCVEWSGASSDKAILDMQINNRMMTNEKNKYLTIFESIPNPLIILNRGRKVDNMNLSAARLFKQSLISGSQYYCPARDRQLEMELCMEQDEKGEQIDVSCFGGLEIHELLPWLKDEVELFHRFQDDSMEFEKDISYEEHSLIFRVKLSKSLDISGKFDGTIIILENITSLKKALEEVKTLKGFIPICSHCKNIRDDQGFWQQLELYVADRSEAEFSHSICPDCIKKYYSDLNLKDD